MLNCAKLQEGDERSMFAGHFGLAAAVKAKTPEVPLWALMLGTQLLDVAFVPLFIAGIETIEPVEGGGYGAHLIHADYTHSLLGAQLVTILAGLLAAKRWGKKGGLVIGSIVFSHWLLDLIVHRADLPLLPGNAGNFPVLGLGMWKYPYMTIAMEAALITAGFIMYKRSVAFTPESTLKGKSLRFAATAAMAVFLAAALATDVLGLG